MPNTHVPAPGGAMPAFCRVIRLRFALLLLRTANRLSDRAGRIIRQYEDEPVAELMEDWQRLPPASRKRLLPVMKRWRS